MQSMKSEPMKLKDFEIFKSQYHLGTYSSTEKVKKYMENTKETTSHW